MKTNLPFSLRWCCLLLLCLSLVGRAQQVSPKKKTVASTVVQQKKAPTQKSAARSVAPAVKRPVPRGAAAPKKKVAAAPVVPETKQIKQLKGERQALKQQINASEQLLVTTKKDVRSQLNGLLVLSNQISEQEQYVGQITTEVAALSTNIRELQAQLDTLRADLMERKNKYVKSIEYLHRNRMTQSNLLFVLSARSFRELRRRLRYVRAFAKYQREQGEIIKEKEAAVQKKEAVLRGVKVEKDELLVEGRNQQAKLQRQQTERQARVEELNKQEAALKRTLAAQRAKAAALDAQIDRMIQAEIAAAEARRKAEAERRRQAALAEARRKAAAEAKRKAALEAERQQKEAQRQRLEAERKRKEELRLRQEAQAAKARGEMATAKQKAAAAEKAKAQAAAADRAKATAERAAQTAARTAPTVAPTYIEPDNTDRQLSASFEANRGRLYAPISGAYAITSRYGVNTVDGLRGVQLDNKGINLTSRGAASARAVHNGEVSTIFSYGGLYNVIVRHGAYMSVYCNLSSVAVRRGQRVTAGQNLGSIAQDSQGNYTLHFQLRKETARLNPEGWFR